MYGYTCASWAAISTYLWYTVDSSRKYISIRESMIIKSNKEIKIRKSTN